MADTNFSKYALLPWLLILMTGSPAKISAQSASNADDALFELTLDELLAIEVQTSTKTSEKSTLSPAIMSIITANDIKNYGFNTVADALSYVASFVDNGDLALHNFGVRGTNAGVRSGNRPLKFMIDGQPVAFRATSQNFIDKEFIPINLIARIEILRGPLSALYGANAFLGVVNIVTKTGQQLSDEGTELVLQYSQIQRAGSGYTASISNGQHHQHWDYAWGLSSAVDDRAGIQLPRRSPAFETLLLTESATDQAKPLSFYGRLHHDIDSNNKLNVSMNFQQLDVENPFSDINPLTRFGTTRIALNNLFIRSDYEFKYNEHITARAFVTYSQGDADDKDKIEVGAENFYLQRRIGYQSIDIGAEVLIALRAKDSFLLGVDAKHDRQKIESFTRINRRSLEQFVINPDRNETLTDNAIYLQYLRQLSENWRAVLGYRLDDDSVIGKQSSTRVGVVGQLPYGIIVKALAGSAFQAPSPELLYRTAIQAGDIIGNDKLSAQKAATIETSASVPVNKFLQLTLTYFNTKVTDLVVLETDSSNLFATNRSGSSTNGIEFELRYLQNNLDAYLNFTWQNTTRARNPLSLFVLEYRENGELYPEQAANFGLSYRLPTQKITISWNNRWVGDREASSQNVLYSNQFYQLDSYLESTLTIASNQFSLSKRYQGTLRAQLNDLFNSNYVNPGYGGIEFPSLGRQVLLTFEQRF